MLLMRVCRCNNSAMINPSTNSTPTDMAV